VAQPSAAGPETHGRLEAARPRRFTREMIGLRYISLTGSSGYAQVARRYLLELVKLGMPVTWSPMVPGNAWRMGYEPFEGRSVGDPELDPICNLPIPYDVVLLHIMPAFYPRLAGMVRGKRIAASSVWETDRLPRAWRRLLQPVEMLMVPCEWNRPIFRDGGFRGPIEVVPHGLRAGQAPLERRGEDGGEFVFYSINVWSDRKALTQTLTAYLRAFTAEDPVRFVLKTSDRHLSVRVPFTPWYPVRTRKLVSRILKRYRNPAKLTMITQELSVEEIEDLHRQGQCYVSLCHSEGWGMGAFDAAAAGRPVIITGYGGQTEFLPADLANLVKYRMVKAPFRPMEQHDLGHQWAEADIDHAVSLMRHVFENREEARAKARELAQRLCETYQADLMAAKLLECLQRHF
jgi:glycosyltransferase involved in cell wall biosynthesis